MASSITTTSNKTNVIKFTDAVGSIPDSPNNGPINAIDLYEKTRFSSSQGNETFWEGVLPKITDGIVAIDLGFYKGKERATFSPYHILKRIQFPVI